VTARRPHLVFCRVGERSIHREWIGDPATRSYDVWLDCYCDPERWRGEPAKVTDGRDTTKWPRLAALLAQDPGAFEGYETVWVPDDDISIDAAAVERFFAIFAREGLALGAPGLDARSYWSHELTLATRSFDVRLTNFIEVMAPAFSREGLRLCGPAFASTRIGWGLDWAWSGLLASRPGAIGIVDATPMMHTRPVGGSYDLAEAGAEQDRIAARYGVELPFRFRHFGGLTRGQGARPGKRLGAGVEFYARLLAGAPPTQRLRAHYWKLMLRSL
jgi:hypothetical protein